MTVTRWTKIGGSTLLAKKYGKWLASQNYLNPHTGAEEEYIQFGQKDWSVVLAVTADLQVLAVKQYKQGCDKIILELPAGTADFTGERTENPLKIMAKELLDETGYEAGAVYSLGSYWIASRNSPTRFHCFLATDCMRIQEPERNPNEPIELVTIPLQKWISMSVFHDEVEEPSAVVTTARALPHLFNMLHLSFDLSLTL